MIGLFVFAIIGLIIYNIIDTVPLIVNFRCIVSFILFICALRAISSYTDKEIKPLTISLCVCVVSIIIIALTF